MFLLKQALFQKNKMSKKNKIKCASGCADLGTGADAPLWGAFANLLVPVWSPGHVCKHDGIEEALYVCKRELRQTRVAHKHE